MEKIKKYIPIIILIVFLVVGVGFPVNESFSIELAGSVLLFIGVIILFEFIERSRLKRRSKWSANRPGKLAHILKFSIFFGLPLSAIIIFIIRNKAELFYSVLFIAIPLVIIFGWIGLLDWQNCGKENLEEKYKVTL